MLQKMENQYQFINYQADEVYYDFTFRYTPSRYIHWDPSLGEQGGWKETREEEATDLELLCYAEKSSIFEFLHDSAEDIYDLTDGETI